MNQKARKLLDQLDVVPCTELGRLSREQMLDLLRDHKQIAQHIDAFDYDAFLALFEMWDLPVEYFPECINIMDKILTEFPVLMTPICGEAVVPIDDVLFSARCQLKTGTAEHDIKMTNLVLYKACDIARAFLTSGALGPNAAYLLYMHTPYPRRPFLRYPSHITLLETQLAQSVGIRSLDVLEEAKIKFFRLLTFKNIQHVEDRRQMIDSTTFQLEDLFFLYKVGINLVCFVYGLVSHVNIILSLVRAQNRPVYWNYCWHTAHLALNWLSLFYDPYSSKGMSLNNRNPFQILYCGFARSTAWTILLTIAVAFPSTPLLCYEAPLLYTKETFYQLMVLSVVSLALFLGQDLVQDIVLLIAFPFFLAL